MAALLALAGCNLAQGQDSSSAPSGDEVTKLRAENATLKKEVADAAHTIAQLQAQLAKVSTAPAPPTGPAPPGTNPPGASGAGDNASAGTNAAPTGPLRALPLDATNADANAAAPGTASPDAGPSKTYTVVKGDSVWKIAHKMYPGDTKNGVDKIQEANKDAIGGKPLKIGQVLTIP